MNHQSNGRSRPLSRSWNRVVANVGMEKDNFNLLLKTWYRIPEDEHNDDNPDITRYMGYGELWGIYYWKGQRFAAMLRNNLRSRIIWGRFNWIGVFRCLLSVIILKISASTFSILMATGRA